MNSPEIKNHIICILNKYKVHLFVFFLTLFIGLTLAHPAILLNDEFITASQLRQLHEGHQIIINEGKYGFFENGTITTYFVRKSNLLVYSLYVPMVSLPAYWIIDLTGEHFVFFILVLWTVSAIILLLLINCYFTKFSHFRGRRWTPLALGVIFLAFFVNLFFYRSFPVDNIVNFPEILAIVFTNIIILAFTAVIIYEILMTIFNDISFSFFGTFVCLFSSSYFFWATYCKDHTMILPLCGAIFLCFIRFVKTDEYWYLPLAFLLCGTLAWGRPELAIMFFVVACIICGYTLLQYLIRKQHCFSYLAIISSPLYTIIGALPFFTNNYYMTKNILLPPSSLYLVEKSVVAISNSSLSLFPSVGIKSPFTVITMFLPSVPESPQGYMRDLTGIFIYPQNGSISVFAIVPLAIVLLFVLLTFFIFKKIEFSGQEKKFISVGLLISAASFCAYASQVHLLNTDPGIFPDIRYFTPLYLPLTILGLMAVKKLNFIPEKMNTILWYFFLGGIAGAAMTVFFLPVLYTRYISYMMFEPVQEFFSIFTLILMITALCIIVCSNYQKFRKETALFFILLLCIVPFFWQVGATFMFSTISYHAKYDFWIPGINEIWKYISVASQLAK